MDHTVFVRVRQRPADWDCVASRPLPVERKLFGDGIGEALPVDELEHEVDLVA